MMDILSNAEPECQSHCSVGSEKHRRHHHTNERTTLLLILRGTVNRDGITGPEPFFCAKSDYYSDGGENLEGQGGRLFQQTFGLLVDLDEEWYGNAIYEDDEGDAGAGNKRQ